MAPIILGLSIFAVGALMTAAETRACAYERNSIGPILAVVGLAYIIGGAIAAVF